ncbi:MAG: hypothetical protein E6276_06145 [Clostridiales bacterium]|nr:hypothetical protein [Clostridiales bacterium]
MAKIDNLLGNRQIQQMSLAASRYQSIAKATQSVLSVTQGDRYSRVRDTLKLSNKAIIGMPASAYLGSTHWQHDLENALGKSVLWQHNLENALSKNALSQMSQSAFITSVSSTRAISMVVHNMDTLKVVQSTVAIAFATVGPYLNNIRNYQSILGTIKIPDIEFEVTEEDYEQHANLLYDEESNPGDQTSLAPRILTFKTMDVVVIIFFWVYTLLKVNYPELFNSVDRILNEEFVKSFMLTYPLARMSTLSEKKIPEINKSDPDT